MSWFESFALERFSLDGMTLAARLPKRGLGSKPVLVLLHGFPQTHVMWHRVASELCEDFDLIMPDLRGYGDSDKPFGESDHSTYSKRSMAQDIVRLADHLGIARFGLCGHDRGARVAHRLALDHHERISRLCVMDIAPTLDMYNATNFDFAQAYYHWFHLTQPAPLPEEMIGGNPLPYLHHKLGGWGTGGTAHLETRALAEYERCFCKPETIHALCEDYRAAASIDLVHDRASRARGEQIACDMLVLWGAKGVIHRMFDPLALWRAQCSATVSGHALDCGHFLAEERPQASAQALRTFFAR